MGSQILIRSTIKARDKRLLHGQLAMLSKEAGNRLILSVTQKNAPATIISYACCSIFSNEAARH